MSPFFVYDFHQRLQREKFFRIQVIDLLFITVTYGDVLHELHRRFVGFHGIVRGKHRAIKDVEGQPVGKKDLSLQWDARLLGDHPQNSESVRTALNFAARGETPLGIVYRTDAAETAGATTEKKPTLG